MTETNLSLEELREKAQKRGVMQTIKNIMDSNEAKITDAHNIITSWLSAKKENAQRFANINFPNNLQNTEAAITEWNKNYSLSKFRELVEQMLISSRLNSSELLSLNFTLALNTLCERIKRDFTHFIKHGSFSKKQKYF
jgi:hypothetical protein